MQWRMWMVLLVVLMGGALSGDAAAAVPEARRDTAAGTAVWALTEAGGIGARRDAGGAGASDTSGSLPVPADFVAVMGYRPVRVGDGWGAPDGACSAPTGPTRYGFADACRAHDLGYDLLRYAARTGEPLGPWAREAVDAAFGRALADRCAALDGALGCRAVAAVYHGVVVANSWRQDWRDPRPEPALPWILLASALTLAPVVVEAVCRVLRQRNE